MDETEQKDREARRAAAVASERQRTADAQAAKTITHLAFVTKVVIPGTGERQDEFSRQHHWCCELLPDGAVRISNTAATSRAPFTVVGVGYSYRTEADVSVKAAKARAA